MSPRSSSPGTGRSRRLAWFVGLYATSLLVFFCLVYALRAIIPH